MYVLRLFQTKIIYIYIQSDPTNIFTPFFFNIIITVIQSLGFKFLNFFILNLCIVRIKTPVFRMKTLPLIPSLL